MALRTVSEARDSMRDLFEYVTTEIGGSTGKSIGWDEYPKLSEKTRSIIRAKMNFYLSNPHAKGTGTNTGHDLVVATWNVKERSGTRYGPIAASEVKKLKQDIDPDIMFLQEVTSQKQVDEIAGWLGMSVVYMSNFSDDSITNPYEKLEVAILSKFDLTNVAEYDISIDGSYTGVSERELVPTVNPGVSPQPTRGFLEAHVPSKNLIVITTHLKSQADDNPEQAAEQREAVASAIVDRVTALRLAYTDYSVLVGGDFNISEQAGLEYDTTHEIFQSVLTSLTSDITGSFENYTDGAIDCFYSVDASGQTVLFNAYRANERYGSDHYPVITGRASSNGLTTPPTDTWNDGFTKLVNREWDSQVIRWEDQLVDPRTIIQTDEAPEPWESRTGARFYIGPIPVTDPSPLDVTVVQNYDVTGSDSLRTETEPLIRGSRVRTRIDVDVLYPNADKVNIDFRQTLAALKGCPFTVLRGPMIKEALLKKFDNDEAFELAVKAVEDDSKSDDVIQDLVAQWGTIYDPASKKRVPFLEGDTTALQNVKEQLKRGAPIGERIQVLREIYEEAKGLSLETSINPNVTVMFQGVRIMSVPDTPKAIRARYSFWLVNDLTVSEFGMKFRDKDGNPTFDIKQCVWLKKYIEDVYLTEGRPTYLPPISNSANNKLVMSYEPPSHLPDYDDPDFKFVFTTDVRFVDQNKLGGADFNKRYCEFVSCGFDTKVVMIPVEGEEDPGAQYLGRKNASGRFTITCDLDGVTALTHLKNSVQHWLRHNIKHEREHWVVVENPVLNVMGVNRIVITNMVYRPIQGQPGRYSVDLDWVENRVRATARETLVYHTNVIDEELIVSFMDYLWTVYKDWLDNRRPGNDPEVQSMFKFIFGGALRTFGTGFTHGDNLSAWFTENFNPRWGGDQQKAYGDVGVKLLGDYGVFNRDVIRAAIFTNSEYIKRQKDYLALYWFTKHYDGNLAEFDRQIEAYTRINNSESSNQARAALNKLYSYIFQAYQREELRSANVQRWYNMPQSKRKMVPTPFEYRSMGRWEYIQQRMAGVTSPYFEGGENVVSGFRDQAIFFGKENADDIRAFNNFYRSLRAGTVRINKQGWDRMVSVLITRPSSRKYRNNVVDPLAPVRGPNGADLWRDYNIKDDASSDGTEANFLQKTWRAISGDDATSNITQANMLLAFQGQLTTASETVDDPWDDQSVVAAYRILRAGILYINDQFPGWKDSRKAARASSNKLVPITRDGKKPNQDQLAQLSCYPDMYLPTYIDLFSVNGKLNPVWKKFAPTWSELGKIPPPDEFSFTGGKQMYEQLAVDETSFVDPSFFYHSVSYKKQVLMREQSFVLDAMIGQAIKGATIKINWDFSGDGNLGGEDIPDIMQFLRRADEETGDGNTIVQKRLRQLRGKDLKDGEDKLRQVYLMASDKAVPIARLVPDPTSEHGYRIQLVQGKGRNITDFDGTEILDSEDPDEIKKKIDQVTSEIKDDKFTVRRMFPTFRVRIIDFSTGWYTDNMYDYNAVKSISVTRDKYDADVAILELMNVTGVLDNDKFLTKSQIRDLNIDPSEEPKSKDDKTQGQIFRSIKLREGTSIQVLMGYYSDPSLLDVVFTGRISQVNPGDVVQIVAQGYKTELLNEISWKEPDLTPAEVIDRIFRSLDGEDATNTRPGDVDAEDRVNGTPHLGSRQTIITEKQGNKLTAFMQDEFGEENVDVKSVSPRQAWYGKALDKPYRAANWAVGLVDEDWKTKTPTFGVGYSGGIPVATVMGHTFADLFTDNPDRLRNIYFSNREGGTLDWVNAYQTAYDSLQEVTRFTPGWVCEVLPYDHLATLYIGPPEGDYNWTSRYRQNIVKQLKAAPRAIKSTTPQILDVLSEIGGVMRAKSKYLDQLERKDETGLFNTAWVTYGFKDTQIEKMSDKLGNMVTQLQSLQSDYPGIIKYAIPAFFGFDMIEDENIPLEMRKEFWDAINQIVQNVGVDAIDGNFSIHPGFSTPYSSIKRSSNPRIDNIVEDFAFANYHTEFDPDGDAINDHGRKYVEGAKKQVPFLTFKDKKGKSIPTVRLQDGKLVVEFKGRERSYTFALFKTSLFDGFTNEEREQANKANTLEMMKWARQNFPELEITPGYNIRPEPENLRISYSGATVETGVTVTRPSSDSEERQLVQGDYMRWDGTILDKMKDYYHVFRWWFNEFYKWTMNTSEEEQKTLQAYEAIPKELRDITAQLNGLYGNYSEDSPESKLKMLNESLADKTWIDKRPDRRSFREYHVIASRTDIISNNIVASTKEMHNAILVRYPGDRKVNMQGGGIATAQGGSSDIYYVDYGDTEWKNLMDREYGIPFHKNLKLEERKLLVALEKNAYKAGDDWFRGGLRDAGFMSDPNQYLAAAAMLNHMGEALRPMYRGNIHVWGRPMKPHDWVRLVDIHNEMRGMFEVERVVHNFNARTGFTTTIVPQAVVHVNNAIGQFVTSKAMRRASAFNKTMEIWESVEWILLAWGLFGGVIRKGASYVARHAAGSVARSALKEKAAATGLRKAWQAAATKFTGWTKGKATHELTKKGLENAGYMNMLSWVNTNLGVNFSSAFKHFMRAETAMFAGDIGEFITDSITVNDIPELNGVVSITPLIYQGRPFVAGLKLDDHVYLTRWKQLWKNLGSVVDAGLDNLTHFINGEEEEVVPEVDAMLADQIRLAGSK